MPKTLKNIRLAEISLVDDPANAEAKVVMYKHRHMKGLKMDDRIKEMTPEQRERFQAMVSEGKSEDEAYEEAMKKETDEMADDKALEALKQSIKSALDAHNIDIDFSGGTPVVATRAPEEYIEIGGEKMLKSAVPAPILRKMADQQKQIDELAAERVKNRRKELGEEKLGFLGGSSEARGRLYETVKELGDEDMMKSLEAANEFAKSMFEEKGNSPEVDSGTATYKFNRLVDTYAEQKGVSQSVAYDQMASEHSSLFAQVCAEDDSRRAKARANVA